MEPELIIPVHEARDVGKYRKLVSSMKESGWLGRPVLSTLTEFGELQALTGSHRIAAARKANLVTIPAILMEGEAAAAVLASRYFPKYPPGVAQDLFGTEYGWFGRFIMMDQMIGDRPKPWSDESLEILRELGHEDMIPVVSVRKWPCTE